MSLRNDKIYLISVNIRFMKNRYAPFLLSAPAKVFVLLGAAALFAAGIYGATQVSET